MRKGLALAAIMAITLAAMAGAAEMKGKTSIGIRAPFLIPFMHGAKFSAFDHQNQPFMMGWDIGAEIKRNLSDHFALALSGGYALTYDDTTGGSGKGLHLNNKDNASVKLTGVLIGLDGEYYFNPVHSLRPYLLAGVGLDYWKVADQVSDASYRCTDIDFKVGAGLLLPVTEQLALDIRGRVSFEVYNMWTELPWGYYGPDDWDKYRSRPFLAYFEPSIGLTYSFGGAADADHDGVADAKDKCPGTPVGVKVDKNGCPIDDDGDGVPDGLDKCPDTPKGALVDAQGCPLDSDKDGVFDGLDKCPNTPAGIKVDEYGCPPDSDGDGVADDKDKCPNTPKGARVDKDGCPLDSDKDGVYDGLDKCPDTPAGVQVDKNGCPYDSDYDGVPDSLDKCPGTPRGIKVDASGCPFEKRVTEKITLHINYASNSYDLDEKAKRDLDAIAPRIIAYPETKIEIRGYTDDQNTDEYNLALSQKRAEAVMAYLESKGVPAAQMTAKGLGEDPKYFVADNKTPEGRRQNRRVEIESAK